MTLRELKEKLNMISDEKILNMDVVLQVNNTFAEDMIMDYISDEAYEPAFGARPLKRYLQKTVETLLAKKILGDEVHAGETITLDVADLKGE